MGLGSGAGSMISASPRTSSRERSREVFDRRPKEDRVELRPGEHFGELGEERRTADEGQRAVADVLEQRMRRAVPEEPGEQHVGINDRPHAAYVDARRARL